MSIPIVFISYSWSNTIHEEWVLTLAKKLMSEQINVILDKWELRLGHDLNHFMEDSIERADKVLIICDQKYKDKSNSRSGGVGIETSIITPDVYNNTKQEKFIPVFKEKDENDNNYVPTFLKSTFGIDFSEDDQFEKQFIELCNEILNNPSYPKPEIGDNLSTSLKKISENADFELKVSILFSSLYLGNSVYGTLSDATRTVQVDVLNIGNRINYIDSIKFCTIQENEKKYHHIIFNPNDIVFSAINPEFGLPINVGKKVTYHFPVDDLLEIILKADKQLHFSVIVSDELGNYYEKNVDQKYRSELKQYFIEKGYTFTDKKDSKSKITNNSSISKNEILDLIYQNPYPNWECFDDDGIFVLRDDINLKIIRDSFENNRPFNEKWAISHPDKNAYANYYFVYYNNNLVDKFLLVSVDGGRADIPLPKVGTSIIPKNSYLKARAVDILGKLDEYIKRSKLIVE